MIGKLTLLLCAGIFCHGRRVSLQKMLSETDLLASEQASHTPAKAESCCCKRDIQRGDCSYTSKQVDAEGKGLCCKFRAEACPTFSWYHDYPPEMCLPPVTIGSLSNPKVIPTC